MKRYAILLAGLTLSGLVQAYEPPNAPISHMLTLTGLMPDEGRMIRVDEFENDHFKVGYFLCINTLAYYAEYYIDRSDKPYRKEHLIKLSICQDETLTECKEIGTDKYITSRNTQGYLENDVSQASINISEIKNSFHACEPNSDGEMNELVAKSLHLSDRRFASIG